MLSGFCFGLPSTRPSGKGDNLKPLGCSEISENSDGDFNSREYQLKGNPCGWTCLCEISPLLQTRPGQM